jgi:ferredoxin
MAVCVDELPPRVDLASGDAIIARVEPLGLDIPVEPGETVFAAARRLGYRWPTICGGEGDCRACYCIVEQGDEHTSDPAAAEQAQIDALRAVVGDVAGVVRLACQLHIDGRVVVRKRGIGRPRNADPSGA